MSVYDYARAGTPKTAAGLGSESMWGVLEMWLADVIKQVGASLPKNLKLDGVAWTPVARGYASVEGKGYSKGDLEAKATVSIMLEIDHLGAAVHMWYKDVSINEVNETFKVSFRDPPSEILRKVGQFFANR